MFLLFRARAIKRVPLSTLQVLACAVSLSLWGVNTLGPVLVIVSLQSLAYVCTLLHPASPLPNVVPVDSNCDRLLEHFDKSMSFFRLEKDYGATRLGATGPRVSKRKIFLGEGLREDLRKPPRGLSFFRFHFRKWVFRKHLSGTPRHPPQRPSQRHS